MNLEGGRRGEAIVAAAGPLSNLILATAGAIPLRYMLANPQLIDQFDIVANVLYFFVQINLLLMIFNFIPIPPLDGSKVMFAFMDRRTEYQIRPVLEQYGFILLIAILFFPPGDSIGLRIINPILDAFLTSWWVNRARQFRAHLRATVTPEERAGLVTRTTPAQLALFDAMHVADRRHGLDVEASLRADGVTDPDLLLAGVLHDAGKGDTGVWPRVAYTPRPALRALDLAGGRGPARVRTGARTAPDTRRDLRDDGGRGRLLGPYGRADP